jgi:hypothetical protein
MRIDIKTYLNDIFLKHKEYKKEASLYKRDLLPFLSEKYNLVSQPDTSLSDSYKLKDEFKSEDLPTKIIVQSGKIREEQWLINTWTSNGSFFGKYHREGDKPAVIRYYPNKNVKSMTYYKNNITNRESDKPSEIEFYLNGNLKTLKYYKDSLVHRDPKKGPALIEFEEDGKKAFEQWIEYSEIKKTVYYDENGKAKTEF